MSDNLATLLVDPPVIGDQPGLDYGLSVLHLMVNDLENGFVEEIKVRREQNNN